MTPVQRMIYAVMAMIVIIEKDAEKCNQLMEQGMLVMHGNASDEQMLILARVEHAKGLMLALASDAEMVYALLTARQINPSLFVIARAIEVGQENKLTMAGANRVVSPYQSVSSRMINAVLRPEVMDMFEMTLLDDDMALAMEGLSNKMGV